MTLVKAKHRASQVTVAAVFPLLTNTKAHEPSFRGRPQTLVQLVPPDGHGDLRSLPTMRKPGVGESSWSTAMTSSLETAIQCVIHSG